MTNDVRDELLANLTDADGNVINPEACAAVLRDLLELHQPQHRHAGVLASRFGKGKCTYCATTGTAPERVYRDYLNGSARKVEMHDHGVMPDPWCVECGGTLDDLSWPCPFVKQVAAAFGVAA